MFTEDDFPPLLKKDQLHRRMGDTKKGHHNEHKSYRCYRFNNLRKFNSSNVRENDLGLAVSDSTTWTADLQRGHRM